MAGRDDDTPVPNKAVALQYDRSDPAAVPRITAKGRDELARRIVEIAREHGITIREDADLVDILEALDVDSLIPIEAYMAVAEILAYVYRENARKKEEAPSHG